MPKKSRRAKARRLTRVTETAQEERSQQSVSRPAESQSPPRVSPKAQDLAARYQYVMPEIKRIGIIAGAMILVLIILSFILG